MRSVPVYHGKVGAARASGNAGALGPGFRRDDGGWVRTERRQDRPTYSGTS